MINFEQLVEKLLLEAPSTTNNLAYYVSTATELVDLRKFLFAGFEVEQTWPDPVQFFSIIASVAARGGTKNYQRFYDFFPLLDFCWWIDAKMTSANSLDPLNGSDISSNIGSWESEFITACSTANSLPNPIPTNFPAKDPVCTYNPVSPTGNKEILVVQKNHNCKPGALGKKAIENFIKNNYSLIQAIANIADLSNQSRGIFTRTSLIPVVDDDIKNVFRKSQDYVMGAERTRMGTKLAQTIGNKIGLSKLTNKIPTSANPKQLPNRLKSLGAGPVMEMSELINTYASVHVVPPSTPPAPPTPVTEKDVDKVLNTKIKDIYSKPDEPSKEIIKWLVTFANKEPNKKNYAGLQSGMAKIASAATGGVQFGK